MQSKMSLEEFEGELKKYGITAPEACKLVWMKTRAVIDANTLKLHMERYGRMSAAYTAAFRLFFESLRQDHEHTA